MFPHKALDANVWTSIEEQVEEFTVPPLAIKRKNEQTNFEQSFLAIRPPSLLLTALKRTDDDSGVIIRLNNPIDTDINGVIHIETEVKEAYRATMSETILEPLNVAQGHDIAVRVKPFEVLTILLRTSAIH